MYGGLAKVLFPADVVPSKTTTSRTTKRQKPQSRKGKTKKNPPTKAGRTKKGNTNNNRTVLTGGILADVQNMMPAKDGGGGASRRPKRQRVSKIETTTKTTTTTQNQPLGSILMNLDQSQPVGKLTKRASNRNQARSMDTLGALANEQPPSLPEKSKHDIAQAVPETTVVRRRTSKRVLKQAIRSKRTKIDTLAATNPARKAPVPTLPAVGDSLIQCATAIPESLVSIIAPKPVEQLSTLIPQGDILMTLMGTSQNVAGKKKATTARRGKRTKAVPAKANVGKKEKKTKQTSKKLSTRTMEQAASIATDGNAEPCPRVPQLTVNVSESTIPRKVIDALLPTPKENRSVLLSETDADKKLEQAKTSGQEVVTRQVEKSKALDSDHIAPFPSSESPIKPQEEEVHEASNPLSAPEPVSDQNPSPPRKFDVPCFIEVVQSTETNRAESVMDDGCQNDEAITIATENNVDVEMDEQDSILTLSTRKSNRPKSLRKSRRPSDRQEGLWNPKSPRVKEVVIETKSVINTSGRQSPRKAPDQEVAKPTDSEELTGVRTRRSSRKGNVDGPTSSKYAIGTEVLKKFGDSGWFEGTIVSYDHEIKYYKIEYEDGDEEEVEEKELAKIVKRNVVGPENTPTHYSPKRVLTRSQPPSDASGTTECQSSIKSPSDSSEFEESAKVDGNEKTPSDPVSKTTTDEKDSPSVPTENDEDDIFNATPSTKPASVSSDKDKTRVDSAIKFSLDVTNPGSSKIETDEDDIFNATPVKELFGGKRTKKKTKKDSVEVEAPKEPARSLRRKRQAPKRFGVYENEQEEVTPTSVPSKRKSLLMKTGTKKSQEPSTKRVRISSEGLNESRSVNHVNDDDDSSIWKPSELQALFSAHKSVDPKSTSFWEDVSELVVTKSMEECREKWFSLAQTPAAKKAAGKSSQRTNRGMSDIAFDDDIFNATPMRGVLDDSRVDEDKPAKTNSSEKAIKVSLAKEFDSKVDKDKDGLSLHPKGYKTYIQNVGRCVRQKDPKSKKGRKKDGAVAKLNKHFSEWDGEGDVEVNGRLSPGGTLQVNTQGDEDDNDFLEYYDDGEGIEEENM